jgi:hypothetical protein
VCDDFGGQAVFAAALDDLFGEVDRRPDQVGSIGDQEERGGDALDEE